MGNKPELLAPAGGRDALVAAVQNGADAVYLGAGGFNARQSADNFAGDGLREAVAYCHARSVRVYVTLNTMVRQDELAALEDTIRQIALSGADAVLVQDFGVARAVRTMVPDLPLHASTQMAAHNRAGVEFLARQGFERVVLAREMSLSEIRSCAGLGTELEVFVHGALCVSCSGQCLFSSMVGGRSGNRGRCAQPCRLKYAMDGKEGHLLSTRDLCVLDMLDELRRAGVDSLKIEGRLKRPEYVCVVTAAYRRAIDHPGDPRDVESLKQMFNRGGFTQGYLPGVDDTALMDPERPNHLGVPVGKCVRPGWVTLDKDIDPADALVLRGDGEDRPTRLSGKGADRISCPGARPGDRLIRLVSEAQMRAARESCQGEHRITCLSGRLTLRVGQPLRLTVSDGIHTAQALGETVAPARSRGADVQRIEEQLRKTGGTAFAFDRIEMDVDENAFCAVSALNALRRDALNRLREEPVRAVASLILPAPASPALPASPVLRVQSANPALLRRAAELGAESVIFAPRDLRADALNRAAEALPDIFRLALPMVMAQGTLETLGDWANSMKSRIASVYISNIGQLNMDWPGELSADYGMNVANTLTLAQLESWGIHRFTPSLELNAGQIAALGGGPELIVHGRIPLMMLRHCPYRAAHGLKGKHASCRHCDHCAPQDRLEGRALTDRTGAAFPLRRVASEDGCVIELTNSVPLMLLKRAKKLPKAAAWRILTDDPGELETLLRLYALAARNQDFRSDPGWAEYETMNTTTGHYFRGAE